jgi:diphthine-ammonia ligase
MKAFVSWSGGKDCMFALYKFLGTHQGEVHCLLNMTDGHKSRSHGLSTNCIKAQAELMQLDILQPVVDQSGYENCFKQAIGLLIKEGVTHGVFGDIYLMEHRSWIERVCNETGITPIFPLWEADTKQLLHEFISLGFRTILVSVDQTKLAKSYLGRCIDLDFYRDITALPNTDACAENGEYHTFVFDGPLFSKPLNFTQGEISKAENRTYLEIICQ